MSLRPLAASIVRLCTLVGVVAASLAACARGTQQTGAAPAPSQPPPAAIRDSVRPAPADTVASRAAPPRPAVVDTTPRPAVADTTSRRTAPPAAGRARGAEHVSSADRPRTSAARGALGSRAGARHMSYRDAGSDLDSLLAGEGAGTAAGKHPPGKAHHRVLRQSALADGWESSASSTATSCCASSTRKSAAWNRLDPSTPVQPALHLIVVVANAHPGPSGKYRTRHDSAMIEKVYGWAKQPERAAVPRPAGGAEHAAAGAAVAREVPRAPRRASGHRPRVLDEDRRASRGRASARTTRPTSTTRRASSRTSWRSTTTAEGSRRAPLHRPVA